MHIPDGYISPQTYIPAYGVMAIVWTAVSARLKKSFNDKAIPLLALSASFVFVIMMFNLPAPGGTSLHAVGAVLAAILLGPAAACVAVTITLVAQALLFHDGGITAIAANCFLMAVVMPFVGYGIYRLLGGTHPWPSKLRPLKAGIAGYIGLNAAAFCLAVLLGIQPMVAHDPAGTPLYAPYPLQITVPAIMLEHLLIAGFVEGLVTGMVVAYLQKTEPSLLGIRPDPAAVRVSPEVTGARLP